MYNHYKNIKWYLLRILKRKATVNLRLCNVCNKWYFIEILRFLSRNLRRLQIKFRRQKFV